MNSRTRYRRQQPDITRLVRVVAGAIKPVYLLMARPVYEGMEHLPTGGAFVLTPNHSSELDPITMAMSVYDYGLTPMFLAKDSLFRVPVVGWILRHTGQVPVYRGTADSSKALSAAQIHLAEGKPVIIYPEGTLTRDPELWPMYGFPGAARLALAMKVPVIPVAHWGDQEILGRGPEPERTRHFRPFPRRNVRVRFGPAVDLSRWTPSVGETGGATSEDRLRAVPHADAVAATGAIMEAITALLAELRGEPAPALRWDRRRGERR